MAVSYNNKGLVDHIKYGIVWAGSGFVMATLATFAHISYLSRNLTPAELGVYFLFFSSTLLITTIAGLGLPEAIIKYIAKAHRNDQTFVSRTIKVVSLLVNTSCVVLAITLLFFGDQTLFYVFDIEWNVTQLVLICAWFILLTKQSIQASTFRAAHNIKKSTFFGNTFRNVLYFLITVLINFLHGKLDLTLALYGVVIAVLINNVVAHFLRAHYTQSPTKQPFFHTSDLEILKLSLPLLLNFLIQILLARIGIWALGHYAAKETVAIYGAAVQFSALMTLPLLIINSFTMPLIADMYHNDADTGKLQQLLRTLTTVFLIPILAVYMAFFFMGDNLLVLFFGQTYSGAYPILMLLATGQVFNLMAGPCGLLLKMTNHHNLLVKVNCVFAIAVIAATLFAAPRYGAIGVAVVAMFGFATQNLISLVIAISKTKINTATFVNPKNLLFVYNNWATSSTNSTK